MPNLGFRAARAADLPALQAIRSLLILTILATAATSTAHECPPPLDRSGCREESEHAWSPSNEFTTPALQRFYDLDELIENELAAKNHDAARALSVEYLTLAETYRCNWHYGDAIHDGNRTLGLIQLEEGEVDAAAESLAKAGRSPGSPVLGSFGPTFDLANALLARGRRTDVEAYLRDVQCFWETDYGMIDYWLQQLAGGQTPQLGQYPELGPAQSAIVALPTVWPVMVSLGLLFAYKGRIRRKGLYLAAAILTGYLASIVIGFIASPWLARALEGSASITAIWTATSALFGIVLPSAIAFAWLTRFVDEPPRENG